MGLFGKKRKNEVADFEAELNNGKDDLFGTETKDKKVAKIEAAIDSKADMRKQKILEALNLLRQKMYRTDGFDNFGERCQELMSKLKLMEDNPNQKAVVAVDTLMMRQIKVLSDHCSRKNVIASFSTLDVIESYINDRGLCGAYYANPAYVRLKESQSKLYLDTQAKYAKIKQLSNQNIKLVEMYNDPKYAADRVQILNTLNGNKEEIDLAKALVERYTTTESLIKKSLSTFEENAVNADLGNEYNFLDEIDNILEMAGNNNVDFATIDKFNNKLKTTMEKTLPSKLVVNTTDVRPQEESIPTTLDVNKFL